MPDKIKTDFGISINGDCLDVMKGIPDKSIDCIVCDPPYRTTACKWDSIIPFDLMWEQLERIIKDDGAIVLDFTMGSGSTGVACMETGRKFIGIELDEQYFKISCGRVKQALEYKNDYGDW